MIASGTEDLAAIRAASLAERNGRGKRKPRGYTERSRANIDRWRAANPNKVRSWLTRYGCVVVFWGFRVYYGNCKHCGVLVTARRPEHYQGKTGAWPATCPTCREERLRKHNTGARDRMRRLRSGEATVIPSEEIETRKAEVARYRDPAYVQLKRDEAARKLADWEADQATRATQAMK